MKTGKLLIRAATTQLLSFSAIEESDPMLPNLLIFSKESGSQDLFVKCLA